MSEMIAVIGAGNGGCTIAADLTLNGYEVNLYEIPERADKFKPLVEKKEIIISSKAENGTAKLEMATTQRKLLRDWSQYRKDVCR